MAVFRRGDKWAVTVPDPNTGSKRWVGTYEKKQDARKTVRRQHGPIAADESRTRGSTATHAGASRRTSVTASPTPVAARASRGGSPPGCVTRCVRATALGKPRA